MNKIEQHQKDWELLGEFDPLWAVLSDNSKRFNNWDLNEFLATGQKEVDSVVNTLKDLSLFQERGQVLDFGCGVGRLARHYLKYFNSYTGSDISSSMIERARKINQDLANANFVQNGADLSIFQNKEFNLVYSGIVLQHMPDVDTIKQYILDFKRILKTDGVLVFQLPSKIPLTYRFHLIRRLYVLLRKMGLSDNLLYKQLGLYPIKMTAVSEPVMRNFLEKANFKVIDIRSDSYCGPNVESRTYYCQI